jgi:hypothetical protein
MNRLLHNHHIFTNYTQVFSSFFTVETGIFACSIFEYHNIWWCCFVRRFSLIFPFAFAILLCGLYFIHLPVVEKHYVSCGGTDGRMV